MSLRHDTSGPIPLDLRVGEGKIFTHLLSSTLGSTEDTSKSDSKIKVVDRKEEGEEEHLGETIVA